jgi:gliding motility associated protien GldN
MKTLSKLICVLSFASIAGAGVAQNVLDGVYVDENTPARRVIPYTFLRQADVLWSQRIWRVIDLREKENLDLYYPMTHNQNRECLWDLLTTALKSGELTAYEDNTIVDPDNTFQMPLTKAKILQIIEPVDSGEVDDNGNPVPPVPNPVTPDKLRGYMIKEDWFFDKQRSVQDVRILGIAPIAVTINKNTKAEDTSGTISPMFWVYFPQARPLFAVKEVFNTHSDAERRTYEDVFWKRQFASYVFMESNVYNRLLLSYVTGIDRLLEGEKIKKKQFDLEHDMWQY